MNSFQRRLLVTPRTIRLHAKKRSAGRGRLRDRDIELLKVHRLGQMLAEASRLASGDILLRPEPGERERGYVAKLAHLCEQIEPGAIRQPDVADQQVEYLPAERFECRADGISVCAAWAANIPIVPKFRERSRDEASE